MDINSVGKQGSLNSSVDRGTRPSLCLGTSVLVLQPLIKQDADLRNVACCRANPWVTQQCNARACSVVTDCSVFLSTLLLFFLISSNYVLWYWSCALLEARFILCFLRSRKENIQSLRCSVVHQPCLLGLFAGWQLVWDSWLHFLGLWFYSMSESYVYLPSLQTTCGQLTKHKLYVLRKKKKVMTFCCQLSCHSPVLFTA